MNKLYSFISFIFLCVCVSGQNIDSLLTEFDSSVKSRKIEAANRLYEIAYEEGYCDSLIVFNKRSSARFIDTQLLPPLSEFLSGENRYDKAEALALRGVKAAEETGDKEMAAQGYSVMFLCCQLTGDFDRALDYAKRCYEIDGEFGVSENLSSSLNNLAGICLSLHHNEDAKEYIDKAIEIERPLNRKGKLAIRLGMASEIYLALGQYDDALRFSDEALELDLEEGNASKAAIRRCQIAAVYQAKRDFPDAVKYYSEAINPLTETGNDKSLSICFNSLGNIAMLQGKDAEARKWLTQAVGASKRSGYALQQEKACSALARLLKESHPIEAVVFFEQAFALRDSLFTAESERQLNSFNVKYKTSEKEHRIQMQQAQIGKQRSELVFLAVIILLLAALTVALIVTARTQRRRNRELQEMNLMKSKFFSIISHDLKNPIIAQKNALEAICVNYDHIPVDVLHSQCVELMRSSSSMLELLFNLLNWSRLETGRVTVTPTKFDLRSVCEEVESLMKTQLSDKRVALSYDKSQEAFVEADRTMVTTILRNLLGNALKFSYPDSVIEVYSSREGDVCAVSVKDRGTGIREDKLSTIFTLNCQRPSTGTSGEQGTGLGLVICQEMIERNGGKISIKSREGEGTIVTFTLKSA